MTATIADSDNALFDAAALRAIEEHGQNLQTDYLTTFPFPHTVIDDFLPEDVLEDVLAMFPGPDVAPDRRFENEHEIKSQYTRIERLPAGIRQVLFFMNSPPVLRFLEQLTGITGLIPDPYLEGGGLHQLGRGGKLDVHADFNRLENLRLDRRINLLLYLNHDWKDEYGGHLELWDREMTSCVKRILPVFNRCVIFNTTSWSYHGNPEPVACPEGMSRKSIAMYYYTNGRPEEEQQTAHSTLWRSRPGEKDRQRSLARSVKRAVRAVLPPILTETYRYVRGTRG